jgi:hypothetical protein
MNKYTFTIPVEGSGIPAFAMEGMKPWRWSPWECTKQGWLGDQLRRALCKGAPLTMTYDGQNLIFVLDDPEGNEDQAKYDKYRGRIEKKYGDLHQRVIANIAKIK